MRPALMILTLLLAALVAAPDACAQEAPEIVVTRIFLAEGPAIDEGFLANGGRDLVATESVRLVSLLKTLPHYRVHDSFIENPATSVGSLGKAGNRIYLRGIVSRADIARNRYFGSEELWTFSVTVSLEFFDIQSGQVYYTRSITSRAPVETSTEIDAAYRQEQFTLALRNGLTELVGRIGKDYLPSTTSARVIRVDGEDRVFLDAGSNRGFYPGLVVQLRGDTGNWMLKLLDCGEGFSRARVQASSGGGLPPVGGRVQVDGLNSSAASGGRRLAVAGVTTVDRGALDPAFSVDNATMGQWLHDALAESAALPLLPPLLADGGGTNALQAAFFDAQAAFSVFGDVRESEILGNRAYPDLLVRGVITHALTRKSRRLGYEAHTLVLGVSLEIYDRRTRETLFSVSHEQSRLEKQSEKYRQSDLEGAWRDLAKLTLVEAAGLVVKGFKTGTRLVEVQKVEADGSLRLAADARVTPGQKLELVHPELELKDGEGKPLGTWQRVTGIVEIVPGSGAPMARVTLSDGSTPAKGDRLVVPETLGGDRPVARLESFEIKGDKVTEPFDPNPDMVLAWLQRELAASGRFMMLPPASQQAAFDAADATLAGGEFKLADQGELLSPTFPEPEVLVKARLGLVRLTRTESEYKNKLKFEVGMELQFFYPDGSPWLLPNGTNRVGGVKFIDEEQVKDRGQVVQGVPDEEFDQAFTACLAQWTAGLAANLNMKGKP